MQPVVQQKSGLSLCESEFLGADLGQFSPGPQPSQTQGRVGAASENEVDVFSEVLYKKLHRLAAPIVGCELVVVEHQRYLLRHLAKFVHEPGKYGVDDPRAS